jgi:hypothetical protein
LQELAVDSPNAQEFSLNEGLIKKSGKVWIGANIALQTKIIQAFHSSPTGGHSGSQATYQRIQKLFCWKGLKNYVTSFIKQCQVCQQAKHENCKYSGLLSLLPIPSSSWQDVSMDFIGLPLSNGYSVILVAVDRFTKYCHFSLKHPYTAQSVAAVFLDNVVKFHGLPKTITFEMDKVFTSAFWKALFEMLGVKF